MKTKLILCMMMLSALAVPTVADEVEDLIRDLNGTDPEVRTDAAFALRDCRNIK